jgi:hypothetical protein
MTTPLFANDRFRPFEEKLKQFLNAQPDFLTARTARSPRAAGDAIQDIISAEFANLFGKELCLNYSSEFARRAMADLAFEDDKGNYYVVDVKTHRRDTSFNMPNLISVERLSRFYEDDRNSFLVLMVRYEIAGLKAVVTHVTFVPIEFLSWSCLTIGALGWGQIQIANANRIVVDSQQSRRSWMLELCDTVLEFYPKEIKKIAGRMEKFEKIRAVWEAKPA